MASPTHNIPHVTPETDTPHQHGHSIEASKQRWQQYSMGRPVFLRALAILGGGVLADQITNGQLSALLRTPDEEQPEDTHDIEAHAQQLVQDFEASHPGETLSQNERTQRFIDYVGCALFGTGIHALLQGNSIGSTHYLTLAGLSALKYQISNTDGRKHLEAETISSAKAFCIIGGTIAFAEGMHADMESALRLENEGAEPRSADRIAAMCMAASVLSPLTTTVGSATVIKKMSNALATKRNADGTETHDPKIMAACTSHISNLSGYILFGDPPFIAIVEKYGFKEGIAWQCKTMLPLYLWSLFSAMFKLNLTMAHDAGREGMAAAKQAVADTAEGFVRNIPFLTRMLVKHTTMNAARFAGMQGYQDPRGIEFWIGEQLGATIANMGKLPFSSTFDRTEAEGGMIHGEDERRKMSVDGVVAHVLRLMSEEGHRQETRPSQEPEARTEHDEEMEQRGMALQDLGEALRARNFDEVRRLAGELGCGEGIEYFIDALSKFDAENQPNGSHAVSGQIDGAARRLAHALNPLSMFRRTVDIDRIKSAVGHNLGDVINVFPFQAGCVPFLVTAFNDAKEAIQRSGITGDALDAVMFFLIARFSGLADNYVACKVGLELYPDKPQLPLAAAIQGGSVTAVGNMANVAQFDLQTFSLPESLRQWRMHLDTEAAALGWSILVGRLQSLGWFVAPPVRNAPEASQHASVTETKRSALMQMLGTHEAPASASPGKTA